MTLFYINREIKNPGRTRTYSLQTTVSMLGEPGPTHKVVIICLPMLRSSSAPLSNVSTPISTKLDPCHLYNFSVEIKKSSDRKPAHNEPSSPASVSLPYNNSGKAGPYIENSGGGLDSLRDNRANSNSGRNSGRNRQGNEFFQSHD